MLNHFAVYEAKNINRFPVNRLSGYIGTMPLRPYHSSVTFCDYIFNRDMEIWQWLSGTCDDLLELPMTSNLHPMWSLVINVRRGEKCVYLRKIAGIENLYNLLYRCFTAVH
jgi:hypothetical protein